MNRICLVKVLENGIETAFDVIFNRYHKCLYEEVFSHLPNVNEADDVVQEVFLCLWKDSPKDPQGLEPCQQATGTVRRLCL